LWAKTETNKQIIEYLIFLDGTVISLATNPSRRNGSLFVKK